MIVDGYAFGRRHPIPTRLIGSTQHSIRSSTVAILLLTVAQLYYPCRAASWIVYVHVVMVILSANLQIQSATKLVREIFEKVSNNLNKFARCTEYPWS